MPKYYPLSHPLGSASAKVKRANMHIQSLNRSIGHALDPEVSFNVKGELKGDGPLAGTSIQELSVTPNTREGWGLTVGDIVTNLRSALDHWALAQKHIADSLLTPTDEQLTGIAYPLRRSQPTINPLILPAAHNAIKYFQPNNSAHRKELELLAVLDDLSRQDKHRIVLPSDREVRLTGGSEPVVFMRLNKPAKQRFMGRPESSEDLKPYFTFDEVLYPPSRGFNGFSLTELPDIRDLIRDKIIPAFAGFFA